MPTALYGSVARTVGMTVSAAGFPAPVGAVAEIERETGAPLLAEVIGFRDDLTLLYPFADMGGVRRGNRVRLARTTRWLRVGQAMLGRVFDSQGIAVDQKPQPDPLRSHDLQPRAAASLHAAADPRAAVHRHPRDRRAADLRQGAADGHFLRLRRGQERAAGHDGPLHHRRRDRDRADRRTRPRGQRVHRARSWARRTGQERRRRGHEQRAGAAPHASGADGHGHRRVFPRSGQRRAADDGFADALRAGPAGDRPGRRRAAHDARLSALGVRHAAEAGRARRPQPEGEHHRLLHRAGRGRRSQRADRRHRPRPAGRPHLAFAAARLADALSRPSTCWKASAG